MARTWELAGQTLYLPPALGLIDCGYEYDVVLDVCRQYGYLRLRPVKGTDKLKATTYKQTPCEGTARWDVNVDQIKDRLHRQLYETETPGPGYIHLPADAPPEIFTHWCNEHKVMKVRGVSRVGVWEPVTEHAPQHLWDCAVYATVAGMVAGVGEKLGPYVAPATAPARASVPKPRPREDGEPGFLDGLPKLT